MNLILNCHLLLNSSSSSSSDAAVMQLSLSLGRCRFSDSLQGLDLTIILGCSITVFTSMTFPRLSAAHTSFSKRQYLPLYCSCVCHHERFSLSLDHLSLSLFFSLSFSFPLLVWSEPVLSFPTSSLKITGVVGAYVCQNCCISCCMVSV